MTTAILVHSFFHRDLRRVALNVKPKASFHNFKFAISLSLFAAPVIALAYLLTALTFVTQSPIPADEIAVVESLSTIGSFVEEKPAERCAINFFGLPRAFQSLVLPSIIKHVIEPNADCDYYIHYYHTTEEAAGRSGQGGAIDPTEILLLKESVLRAAEARNGEKQTPIVEFVSDTEEDFWNKYTDLIDTIRNTKVNGKFLYFPWKARTYKHPVTTDNIVKMWHSIQSSHQLMERIGAAHNIRYKTVAMLRSDVVYITPINIRQGENAGGDDQTQNVVTVPDFGKYPVSDRIIYGSANAVKVWSTERFSSLEKHVQYMQKNDPGWGMHSERFLNVTVFPAIRKLGVTIRRHPTLCFLRARADETVWISDCEGKPPVSATSIMSGLNGGARAALERTIGRTCPGKVMKIRAKVKSVNCFRKK